MNFMEIFRKNIQDIPSSAATRVYERKKNIWTPPLEAYLIFLYRICSGPVCRKKARAAQSMAAR